MLCKAHMMMIIPITILLLLGLVSLSPLTTNAQKGINNNNIATPHHHRHRNLKSLPWISKKRQYYITEAASKSPLREDIHVPMIVSTKSGKAKSGKSSKTTTTKSGKGSKKSIGDSNHPSLVHSKSAKVSTKSVKSAKAKSSKAKVYKPYYYPVESDTGLNEEEDGEENEEEQSSTTSTIAITPGITNSTETGDIEQEAGVKTLYIVRHAEHERECNENNTECDEWLRDKGQRCADELANYMKKNDIIDKITHVFASHRPRTSLTVLPVAKMAEVNVTTFPKDAEYSVDQAESVCPTLEAIRVAPLISTIVVAAHGGTIYKILSTGDDEYGRCNGLGLDTSNNQTIYPKDDDGTLPEDEYSNLWKVIIDEDEGSVKLDKHVLIYPPKLNN